MKPPAYKWHRSDSSPCPICGLDNQATVEHRQDGDSAWQQRRPSRSGRWIITRVNTAAKSIFHNGKARRGAMPLIELSSEPGTLWHICLNRYFPANTAISSEQTRRQYLIAMRFFKFYLSHDPTIEDLNDDTVAGWMNAMRQEGKLAIKTINERAGRIKTLWTFLAKKRIAEQFPTVGKFREPKRIPKAWTQDELSRLFHAAATTKGKIGDVPAGAFWYALHCVLWDTGERIGAVMAIEWRWLDWERGLLEIPAEVRKGAERDMSYKLHEDTIAALRKIERPKRLKIFTWPYAKCSLHVRYGEILRRAGLPHDRKSKFHRIRKSVASHIKAAGHNATEVLRHSTEALTNRAYIDPNIVGASRPSEILFRPIANGRKRGAK